MVVHDHGPALSHHSDHYCHHRRAHHACNVARTACQRLDQALSLPPPQRAALFFCLEASMAAPSPPTGGQPAPAVGGHPPVPAVGAHPPVPAVGGPNIPAWDPAWAQVEIERFRTLRHWGCFTQLLAKKLRTTPRRALSAHTTTACQPGKAAGPAGSLKDAGMDHIVPAVGGFCVHVNLPHAFSHGDGLAVTYVSTAEKRQQGG